MTMPRKEKIYEAFTVLADDRLTIEENLAKVKSSDNKKEYIIEWNETEISSTDNETFWQKRPGYPIIAVWMKTEKVKYNKEILKHFAKINWHELNEKNKKDYQKGIDEILSDLEEKNINTEEIKKEVDKIYDQISRFSYEIVRKVK